MAAYAQQPRRRVLRPSVVVDATHAHTHTVIMLHGMAFDSSMFEELPAMLGARASTVRWVFPNAPVRTIDWPRGPAPASRGRGELREIAKQSRRPGTHGRPEPGVEAWYNYFSSNGGTLQHDAIDLEHLAAATADVHAIMDAEIARLGGAARRVALGGNSQGGTVALHAALTHARGLDLACLVLGCTLLLDATPAPREPPEDPPPLFIFSAERDMEYLPAFQRLAFGRLAAVGFDVESHVEPGLDHYSVSRAELLHTAAWLRRALFGDAVVPEYRDRPTAPPAKFDNVMDAPLPAWWLQALQHGHRQPHKLHDEEVALMPDAWRPVFFADGSGSVS